MREDKEGVPESAMVIEAHPDDAEFTVAGTVAKWAKAGCRVTYVICTDGNAGSLDPDITREQLAEIRRAEQRAACATLGVSEVLFLGHDDDQLESTLDLRRELVRAIRRYKPQAVITGDPTRLFVNGDYINHPDHRAAAQAALDAAAPASEMPLLWPELGAPHRVDQLYVHGNEQTNEWVDVTDTIDQKIEALKQHVSQLGDWDPTEMVKEWGAEVGREKGLAYAESYRVMTLRRPPTAD
jgi:LmbE family N-acetylglucosaminyl deacetylase